MDKFTLIKINEIDGKLRFYKLSVNGSASSTNFASNARLMEIFKSELIQVQARMQQLSDLKTMPNEKHKDITPKNDPVKEYEIKTKHLRIYLFHDKENGRIIVTGGKKTTQKKDIVHFRKVKNEYFNLYKN